MTSIFDTRYVLMLVVLVVAAVLVNWVAHRSEITMPREQLTAFPSKLADWDQRGEPIKFEAGVESILRTTDYTMREYTSPTGRVANVYVGYYASQRTGATYHSPQNCLPGAGWVLKDPATIQIAMPDGTTFPARRYVIESGIYREVMIYWYQGRGRIESSEYRDKLHTVIDSVTKNRTDAAMVRVMTSVGDDPEAAMAEVVRLSAAVARELPPFVPN